MFTAGNHPRRYHGDPSSYPLGGNDLDFVGVFQPENDRGRTPIEDRWMEVLVFFEAEIRALHRQLRADRAAALAQFNDATEPPDWTPPHARPFAGMPSGKP